MSTMQGLFDEMNARLTARQDKIATLNARYQFELTGEDGGTYHAIFDNGATDIGEGPIDSPACTVTMTVSDFQAMVAGKLNATAAFMTGKLRIKGDMGLAMKLQMLIG